MTRRGFGNRKRNCREDRNREVQSKTGIKQSDQKEDHRRHLESQEAEILKHRVVVRAVLILVKVAKTSSQDDQGEGRDRCSAPPSPQEVALSHEVSRETLEQGRCHGNSRWHHFASLRKTVIETRRPGPPAAHTVGRRVAAWGADTTHGAPSSRASEPGDLAGDLFRPAASALFCERADVADRVL